MDERRLWQLEGDTRIGVVCTRCGGSRLESARLLCGEGRLRNLSVGDLALALRCVDSHCRGIVGIELSERARLSA